MGALLSIVRNGLDQSFNIPAPLLTEKNLPDQSSKVFVITGANSGVGYELASLLFSRNGTIYLGCRSKDKAEEAISSIRKAHPNSTGALHFLRLDLSDLNSIKASAQDLISRESKIHWLNNNAGVMLPPKGSKGQQGHELQHTTNVLGPFLFTKLLLPLLQKTAKQEPEESIRVSWAGSYAVDSVPIKGGMSFIENENKIYSVDDNGAPEVAYGSSKVANYWLAKEFGRRGVDGNGDGVLHNAYNPGNLKTNLTVHLSARPYIGTVVTWLLNKLLLHPAIMGAYTELAAGLSKEFTLAADQGCYVVPWGRKASWNRADIVANVGEGKGSDFLWQWCERETKAYF